jgi:hypothetical protein
MKFSKSIVVGWLSCVEIAFAKQIRDRLFLAVTSDVEFCLPVRFLQVGMVDGCGRRLLPDISLTPPPFNQ